MNRLLVATALLSCSLAGASDLVREVERAALEAALARVAEPDRLVVESVHFGGADPIGEAQARLEPLSVDGPNSSGVVHVRLRMLSGEEPLGEAFATVRGSVIGPVLVPRRTLSGKQPIDPADVLRVEADLTRLSGEPLRDVEQLVGLVPVRSLGPGRPISRELLAPVPLVRRGETVELEVRRGGLVVRTRGRARTDGARGETVAVESLSSGAELFGLVQGEGSLLVVPRPSGGR